MRFDSLEEIPPELQRQLKEMMDGGEVRRHPDGTVEARNARVTIKNSDGTEEVYDSLQDLPPELRARVEEMRRRGQ